MKKLANVLARIIFFIYFFLWCGIMFLNMFFSSTNYSCKKTFLLSNAWLLMLGFLIIVFWVGLSFILSQKQIHMKKININALTIILFILQAYIFFNMYFHTESWDPWTIYWNAEMISRGESNGLWNFYFSSFPNNQMIVYLQSIIIKLNRLFGIFESEGIFLMILIQCLLTSLTGKLLYDILRTLTYSEKYPFIGWLLFVILLGLSGWNVITYTDMMGLIFPIAIFRIYLSLKDKTAVVAKWILILALTFWGFKIKPTVIIVFIALLINHFILFIFNFEFKTCIIKFKTLGKLTIVGSLCILIFLSAFNAMIQSTGLVIDKEANTGALHMMMMGLNPVNDGVWYEADVELSQGITDKTERTYAQIDKIKERMHDYGLKGFIKHMCKKTLIIFNDGTFAWGCEGGFYDVIYPDKNAVVSPFLKSLYYNEGARYLYLSTVEQFAWIIVLFLSGGIVFIQKSSESLAIVLSLVGIILFNLIFEARARYIILYVPYFIIAAMLFLQKCELHFENKQI